MERDKAHRLVNDILEGKKIINTESGFNLNVLSANYETRKFKLTPISTKTGEHLTADEVFNVIGFWFNVTKHWEVDRKIVYIQSNGIEDIECEITVKKEREEMSEELPLEENA